MDIKEYEFLWTTQKDIHALQKMSNGYLIINIQDNTALIIEDDDISDAVVKEMLRHNCKINF
ncbi:hypothetical protein [Paenibacillus elgii]|uniref:hypothetical protein n=1 Tax=Paenibacillus elgii TaxID=189691 RepID=UPI00203EFE0B|nr:hypothetical protein [Paenibacillus elgii]MCM3269950.1 hypothetical protein [Paenibacillus elgii]